MLHRFQSVCKLPTQSYETPLDVSDRVRIGIDIGGTFTDIVAVRAERIIAVLKLPSTPDDYSRAIEQGLRTLVDRGSFASHEVEAVVHGTTVATNAILEGQGARTGLITTKGFRDVLELRRIRIPELYNLGYDKPPPLVARRYRHEVAERIAADGSVLVPLDDNALEAALHRIRDQGLQALAICFLNSYVNPHHERRAAERARAMLEGVFVTASCEILPEIREYERTSTTVVNAYVGPIVRTYLQRIVDVLRGIGILAPLRIMQSSGGTLDLDAVLRIPAAIVESGPAAGVVAGALLARQTSSRNAITIDMGGTTAKAALIEDGRITKTTEYEVGAGINLSSQLVKGRGHALKLPVVDISEIGAGGGSLAVVDGSGRILVGPESAGSVPGPVAYGRGGTTVTLTDALVVMGYINATALAGGSVPMDGAAARAAIQSQIA
jgi:N-methylhydantoinase A